MKRLAAALLLSLISPAAFTDTTLPVIGNFERAGVEDWKKVDKKDVPQGLVVREKIANPALAYQAPYTTVFLQNERMVVCFETCDKKQKLKVKKVSGSEFSIDATDFSSIRQTTVYYWANRLFDRLAEFGFRPTKRLIVRVDRDIEDPASGLDMSNNAFFNDADWSLSFLPLSRSLLTKLMGLEMGPSGNDPSVIMHEASHAVFQQVIGDILNPEIYGLHEAFADYFAMMLLETPYIGNVMMRGKPLRKADQLIAYRAKMEVHDLGNVVSSALWKIRGLIGDKTLADRIALESIKKTAANPYGSAGDYVTAHMQTAVESGLNSGLINEINGVWTESLLTPYDFSKINKGLISAAPDDSKRMRLRITTLIPEDVQKEMGMKSETLVVTKGELRENPSQTGAIWAHFNVASSSTGGAATDSWVYYNTKNASIHGAVSVPNGQTIAVNTPDMKNLIKLGEKIGDILTETEGNKFSAGATQIFNLRIPLLISAGNERVTARPTLTINGQTVEGTEITRTIRVGLFAKFAGALAGPELKAILKRVRQVSLITVPASSFSDSRLPTFPGNGQTVVGYKTLSGGGLVETVLVEEIR